MKARIRRSRDVREAGAPCEHCDGTLRNEVRVKNDLGDRQHAAALQRSKTAGERGVLVGNFAQYMGKYHDIELTRRHRARCVSNDPHKVRDTHACGVMPKSLDHSGLDIHTNGFRSSIGSLAGIRKRARNRPAAPVRSARAATRAAVERAASIRARFTSMAAMSPRAKRRSVTLSSSRAMASAPSATWRRSRAAIPLGRRGGRRYRGQSPFSAGVTRCGSSGRFPAAGSRRSLRTPA